MAGDMAPMNAINRASVVAVYTRRHGYIDTYCVKRTMRGCRLLIKDFTDGEEKC